MRLGLDIAAGEAGEHQTPPQSHAPLEQVAQRHPDRGFA